MEGKLNWLKKKKQDRPTMLDVIEYKGKEYQVAGGSQKLFLLNDLETDDTFRVKGKFSRFDETREPGPGNVFRRDEGVRVTGLISGKILK
jgi:hypothetical protein